MGNCQGAEVFPIPPALMKATGFRFSAKLSAEEVVYAKRRHETIGPWNSGSTDLFLECFQRLSGNGKERTSKTTHCLISSVVIVILATFQGLLYFFESALNLGNGMLNFWVAEGVILTGGEGTWKPVITCWVHLELMCIFPTM